MGKPSITKAVLTVFGIEFILNGGGSMIWFIPAIMIFYLAVPFYLKLVRKMNNIKLLIISLAIWSGIMLALENFTENHSLNIFLCRLPIIFLGLCLAGYEGKWRVNIKAGVGVVLLVVGIALNYNFGYMIKLAFPISDIFYVTAIPYVMGIVLCADTLFAKVKSYFQLATINEELTQENLYLAHRLQALNAQKEDSIADSLAHASALLQRLAPYKLIPAKIVHASLNKRDNLLTIDKGARDGIKRDMGVVCGTGVVGIVYLTSEHYAVVIPVLSSQSSISCVIENRGYFGYLHWTGGDISRAFVDDIPRHAHFKLYENVVTSGYSSVFPAGIPVGKILHVYNSPDQMSYRLQLQLSTNFGTLRDVFVVDNSAFAEQMDILRAAEDSMRVKNGGEK